MPDVNIRSSDYFIARSHSTCSHCLRITAVTALAVPPGHEVLLPEEDGLQQMEDSPVWERMALPGFLFQIESLPESIQRRLPAHVGIGSGWSNHCEHCGARLEDQDLFCEPGAAFCPDSAARARTIHLLRVAEPFAAFAAGYAPDPEFFHAISRC